MRSVALSQSTPQCETLADAQTEAGINHCHGLEWLFQLLKESSELLNCQTARNTGPLTSALYNHEIDRVPGEFDDAAPHRKLQQEMKHVPDMGFAFLRQLQMLQPQFYFARLNCGNSLVSPMRHDVVVQPRANEQERTAMERHLRGCIQCRRELENLLGDLGIYGFTACGPSVRPEARKRLMTAIAKEAL